MSRISLENKSDSWETRIKRNFDVETSHFVLESNEKTEKVNRTQGRQSIKCEKDSHIIWTEISKSRQDKTYTVWGNSSLARHLSSALDEAISRLFDDVIR